MLTRKRCFALLLITTAFFAPSMAEAAPLTAFVGGFLNAMGAGTWLASGAVGAWSTGFSVGAFFGGSVIARTLLGIGLSSLAQAAMRPKVPSPSQSMTNYAQSISYQERGYGRVRKGGPFAFTARKGTKRHYGVIIAAHRTKGLVEWWLDKRLVETDGSGNAITAPITGFANLRAYDGHPGQTVDAVWDATFAEVTSSHDFAGLSYVACTATKPKDSLFSKVMPSGREWALTPVWDMDDYVYDPRDTTRKWTDNLALVIAREAERFGLAVDWADVGAEADICDEFVTNGDGGTQRRWTYNGVFDSSMTWETVRSQLMLAGDVFFYGRRDGKLGFKVGRFITPTITLTDRDFLSLRIVEGQVSPDIAGEFAVRYVEPSRGYLDTPSGAIVFSDNGRRDEIEAYGINSHNQACRVANRMGLSARAQYSVSAQIKMIGYDLRGERFVRITHSETGYDFIMEVGKFARNKGATTFSLEGVSTTAADYEFDALVQEPARPLYVSVAADGDIEAPESLTGSVITGTGGVPMIEWAWPAQPAAYTQQIQIRSLDAGITDWQVLSVGEDQSTFVSQGLVDGASYEAQVRNRTSSGRVSDWAPSTSITVTAVADTTAPGALTLFGVVLSAGNAEVSYKAPNSANYSASRIYRATGVGATFASASVIRTEYGAPNTSDTYTDIAPGTGTHNYWAEAINGSGIAGARSGPATITIT